MLKINCKDLYKNKQYCFLLIGVCCFDCDKFQDVEMRVDNIEHLKEYLKYRHDEFLEYYHVFVVEDNNDLVLLFCLREVVGLYEKRC